MSDHKTFMGKAIDQAVLGLEEGGIPIGAVLVKNGVVIGVGRNRRVQKNSAILHAEMDCLENVGRLSFEDYKQCTMYSTLSPCSMCSGAIRLYGISKVVIGEHETFHGPEWFLEESGIQVINMDEDICRTMMTKFIKKNPKLWYEDIGL